MINNQLINDMSKTFSPFFNNNFSKYNKISISSVLTEPGQDKFTKNTQDNKDVKTAIFYLNDVHGQVSKMTNLQTASDSFDKAFSNDPSIDTFKLAGGDLNIGRINEKRNLWADFINNYLKIDLSAAGNHETENQNFVEESNKSKCKYLSANIKVEPNSPLYKDIKNEKIVKSWIVNRGGHNYGFIGASPTELNTMINQKRSIPGVNVDNLDQTAKDIQQEVTKLENKGINKIIMLSHLGYNTDQKIAKRVSGIDIIIGGHST